MRMPMEQFDHNARRKNKYKKKEKKIIRSEDAEEESDSRNSQWHKLLKMQKKR